MKKLKTKWFNKWAKKKNISDNKLLESIENIENSHSAVNLGGSIFKVRISLPDKGKSSGFRTIVIYREYERVVIVYGFSKNEQENISKSELQHFKKMAKDILALDVKTLEKAIEQNIFISIGE